MSCVFNSARSRIRLIWTAVDIDYNYEDRRNFTVEQIYKIGFRLRVLGC